jgi:hypothetical protein
MKMVSRNKYLFLSFLLAVCRTPAQPISGVDVIVVGSDGNGPVAIKGSEGDLNDLAGAIRSAFGGRIKNELVLPLSDLGDQSCFQKITAVFGACDSNDILITAWIGPWTPNPRNASAANFLNVNEPALTVDYVLNVLRLMPSRTSFSFLLAPGRFRFPPAVLKQYARSAASGGRHLILVSARARMSYTAMIDGFLSALEKMKNWKPLDTNHDGQIMASEWLLGFDRYAREEKIAITPYWLERAPDTQLLQAPK